MRAFLLLLLSALSCWAPVSFDGATTKIESRASAGGNEPPWSENVAISVSMWVRRHDTNTAGLLTRAIPGTDFAVNYDFKINKTKTNRIEFTYLDVTASTLNTFSSPPDAFSKTNVWQHFAFTYVYATPSSAHFWVDGVDIGGAWTTGAGNQAVNTGGANQTTRLGMDRANNFFNGDIAEFALWYNIALNYREVLLLASRVKGLPLQVETRNPAGNKGIGVYWPLDEFPNFQNTTGTNIAIDRVNFKSGLGGGFIHNNGSPNGTAIFFNEKVVSYPPNE